MIETTPANKSYPWSPLQERASCCVPEPLISIQKLSLSYGDKEVFTDISFTINRGCITALVGPSGCGKTSFLMCMNRLIDLVPTAKISGQLSLENEDLLAPTLNKIGIRKRIGMLFQKPNPFPLSIRKNIVLPLREHGLKDKAKLETLTEKVLRDVGLWDEVKDRLDSPALRLSGGQQQRLCLARALALEPEIILMDEPCSALDPLSSGVVEDLISRLRGRFTVLIVTHNLAQARRISDYTAVFWVHQGAGQLIEYGPTKNIFDNPKHSTTAAYVGGIRG
jgi:phosphate transport system ATP-binding protein